MSHCAGVDVSANLDRDHDCEIRDFAGDVFLLLNAVYQHFPGTFFSDPQLGLRGSQGYHTFLFIYIWEVILRLSMNVVYSALEYV